MHTGGQSNLDSDFGPQEIVVCGLGEKGGRASPWCCGKKSCVKFCGNDSILLNKPSKRSVLSPQKRNHCYKRSEERWGKETAIVVVSMVRMGRKGNSTKIPIFKLRRGSNSTSSKRKGRSKEL